MSRNPRLSSTETSVRNESVSKKPLGENPLIGPFDALLQLVSSEQVQYLWALEHAYISYSKPLTVLLLSRTTTKPVKNKK